jgi:hypothetical protein
MGWPTETVNGTTATTPLGLVKIRFALYTAAASEPAAADNVVVTTA